MVELIVQLDANENRREYEYDGETGYFLVRESVGVEVGRLDFRAEYDRGFGQMTHAWYPLESSTPGYEASEFSETELVYDELGRLTEVYDELHKCEPVQAYEYYYGTSEHPISTVVTHALITPEVTTCPGGRPENTGLYHTSWSYIDGQGRARLSVTSAEEPYGFVASGWQELSARGSPVRTFEPFATASVEFVAASMLTPSTRCRRTTRSAGR